MSTVTGSCSYCGKEAEDIPGLKFLRGVLFSDDEGKVHCFTKKFKPKRMAAVVVSKKAVVAPDPVPEPESETSEQAVELWALALEKELAPDIVEGRITGTVTSFGLRGGVFGFIRAANGTEYHACGSEIAADEFNNVFLIPGESVSFRVEDRRTNIRNELSAVAVIPDRVDLSRSAPSDYRAEFVVISYDRSTGEGRLCDASDPAARWVFFNRDDVLTEGNICVGARVWAGLKRRFGFNSGFQATFIEIFMEEKGETNEHS